MGMGYERVDCMTKSMVVVVVVVVVPNQGSYKSVCRENIIYYSLLRHVDSPRFGSVLLLLNTH